MGSVVHPFFKTAGPTILGKRQPKFRSGAPCELLEFRPTTNHFPIDAACLRDECVRPIP